MNRTKVGIAVVTAVAALIWWLWPAPSVRDVVHVAAAGGMACSSADARYAGGAGIDGSCEQRAVSDLVVREAPEVLFGLGDYQYEESRAVDYRDVYGPTWGRLRDVTRPAIGNQEYKVHDANTFTSYFGSRAPDAATGWYSYDLGRWHVVVLNSNCALVGGCDAASPQATWLEGDLAADHHQCTIAYWHHPRWSTGLYGGDARVDAFWQALAAHHADVVVAAHEHDYERFQPLDAVGNAATAGITSFVAGTGGQAVYGPGDTVGGGDLAPSRRRQAAVSAVRVDDRNGALFFTLRDGSFDWRFVGLDGTVLDQGSRECVP